MKKGPLVIVGVIVVAIVGGMVVLRGSGKAAESKPLADVRTEAQGLDVDGLRKMANSYKDAILAKQGDAEKVQAKLKDVPLTELTGEVAVSLKNDVEELTRSVGALKERFDIYVAELKKKGADISGLEL